MNLNLTNLKDIQYICQIATDYFDRRMGTTEEIEWLQRISRYRQLFQGEIYRLEAEASRRVREDLILPPESSAENELSPNEEQRESIAKWMIDHGFSTGHGDTVEDLFRELAWQIGEMRDQLKQDAEIKRLRELLGELADALNCFKSMLHPPDLDLLQRAKEILL